MKILNIKVYNGSQWIDYIFDNTLSDINIKNGEGVGSLKSSNLNDDDRPYTEEELPQVTGHEAFGFGKKIIASGKRSFAFGNQAKATANGAVSIGQVTEATANIAIALGYNTKATAERSMAVNDNTEANGSRSFAANHQTKANGNSSAAFGVRNTIDADGLADFVAGIDNYSNSYAGFVVGRGNRAARNGVFVAGQGNKAEKLQNQAVFGQYNDNKDNTLFEIGNGTSDTDRRNAFEVLNDGRAKVYTKPQDDNDVVRKVDLSNLEKLVDGLTDAQIIALNKFAKSLTVEED